MKASMRSALAMRYALISVLAASVNASGSPCVPPPPLLVRKDFTVTVQKWCARLMGSWNPPCAVVS
jgi:hypothetical protein